MIPAEPRSVDVGDRAGGSPTAALAQEGSIPNGSAAADRVLATLLAVEVVDAAATASRLGDHRWADDCLAFRTLVLDQLAAHDGRPVAWTLDGVLMAFSHPIPGVRCALATIAGAADRGLDLRAGVHTGEVGIVGDQLAGVALFLASGMAAEAGVGEVLVSHTVRDLIVGSGISVAPAGERVFCGLPGEWQLWRLVGGTSVPAPFTASTDDREPPSARPVSVLSRREREVAAGLALGLANRQIAAELCISAATVERHVANILLRLGFRSRTQVAEWAVECGLLRAGQSA